jgi:hypothetical protein
VVQRADHGGRIEQAMHEWQSVDIGRHIHVTVGAAEPGLRLLQLRARIIQEDDPIKAQVARRIPAGACAQLQQEPPACGKQALARRLDASSYSPASPDRCRWAARVSLVPGLSGMQVAARTNWIGPFAIRPADESVGEALRIRPGHRLRRRSRYAQAAFN